MRNVHFLLSDPMPYVHRVDVNVCTGPSGLTITMISGVGFSGSWKLGLSSSLAPAHVKTSKDAHIGVDVRTTRRPAKTGTGGHDGKSTIRDENHWADTASPFYTYLLLNSRLNCTKTAFDPKSNSPGEGKGTQV